MRHRFRDRREAGKQLAERLAQYAHEPDVIVLGLPRGGVPVAYEVATALSVPLDVFVVRKLGVPDHEEYAMGAVAGGGIRVINRDVVRQLGIPPDAVERVERAERAEIERRDMAYRGGAPAPPLAGRVVILVDDGLATGSTMLAAVAAARTQHPRRIVVATPVASAEAREALKRQADDCVCVSAPDPFYGVGFWYLDFTQTTDEEVQRVLATARAARRPAVAHP